VSTHDFLYQLDQITKAPTGEIEFQATHFPIDATGRSLIALDVMAAQAQGYVYSTMRTGLDCDDDSAGDRATDTSVPAEVYQEIGSGSGTESYGAGGTSLPPGDPPTLPRNPAENDPPQPPGGHPPPVTPPSPPPTPPDEPINPCLMSCVMRALSGGINLTCPNDSYNVGYAIFGDGTQYTFCQECEPPTDPDCQQCTPVQLAAGAYTVSYITYRKQYYEPLYNSWIDTGLDFQALDGKILYVTGNPYVSPSDSGTTTYDYLDICGRHLSTSIGMGRPYARIIRVSGPTNVCITSATCP
jgi:hypothetical protein